MIEPGGNKIITQPELEQAAPTGFVDTNTYCYKLIDGQKVLTRVIAPGELGDTHDNPIGKAKEKAWKHPLVTKICKGCGCEFQTANRQKLYHSASCHDQHHSRKQYEKKKAAKLAGKS